MLEKLFPFLKSQKKDDLFDQWFVRFKDSDNFESYMNLKLEDIQECFDNENCHFEEYGTFNKDLKNKYIKIYNKEFDKYKDSELKKLARDWFEDRIDEFSRELEKIVSLTNQGMKGFRSINVDDKKEFCFKITQGEYLEGYDGAGIFWAWDRDRAEAHWGDGTEEVLLKAIIPFSSIDQKETILLNLDPALGYDEAEIRIIEGSEVLLIGMDNEYLSEPVLLKA